jgi:hypothetical protein
LSLITVIPALTTLRSGSRCSDVGPIVATILVSGSCDDGDDDDDDPAEELTKSKLVVVVLVPSKEDWPRRWTGNALDAATAHALWRVVAARRPAAAAAERNSSMFFSFFWEGRSQTTRSRGEESAGCCGC